MAGHLRRCCGADVRSFTEVNSQKEKSKNGDLHGRHFSNYNPIINN